MTKHKEEPVKHETHKEHKEHKETKHVSHKDEVETIKLAKESLAHEKDETVKGIHEGKKPKFGKTEFV